MNKEQLFEEYSKLSANYQRILTKYVQDPVKFANNKSWAQPIIDAIKQSHPEIPYLEAVYRVKKQINETPQCLFCDKQLPFIEEPVHHYGKFCNNVCSAHHREQQKKAK